jgi:hypothetical protein
MTRRRGPFMLREPMPAAVTYLSLGAFYGADPVRRASRERDFGLWWRSAGHGTTYRAAWVQDTGEVYLVQHGLTGHGSGHVEVLARIPHPDRLEARLAGWRDEVGRPGSLRWLRERLEAGTVRERPLPTDPAPAAA